MNGNICYILNYRIERTINVQSHSFYTLFLLPRAPIHQYRIPHKNKCWKDNETNSEDF